jgi:serine/threonine protein kinase
MKPQTDDKRLKEVLTRWERLRDEGQTIEVAELCKDCPDLKEAVTECIQTLQDQGARAVPATGGDANLNLPMKLGRYELRESLGAGGFGTVYRAYDAELGRWVAVKVPHAEQIASTEGVNDFLREARHAAQLDHAHILTVHDAGQDGGRCFIVYKLIEGCNLFQRVRKAALTHIDAALLVAQVAEALDYAHRQGMYHRDIKPGNILMDEADKPFIADFGLAVRESELVDEKGRRAGTVPYMSPEQLRGEGHRIDGRTDIYSLGVVLYELLSGHRPFESNSKDDLVDQILHREAKPPRQMRDSIPRELERICLKTISKRVNDRYTTAKDLAEELRSAVQGMSSMRPGLAAAPPSPVSPMADSGGRPDSSREPLSVLPVRVVPKGLRSFGPEDSDFFLELLPGPRDREGLPDSIRFWKRQIEKRDPSESFSVGLIYGPSGCGKSSLVKAGLLSRLAPWVESIYIEATRDDTESRLERALRRACPWLKPGLTLSEMIASLRRDEASRPGRKTLIVLDQFEQWLHARGGEDDTELLRALRQCDGARVQCIVMVRDDFWIAISRFMKNLEVRLLEGHNIALVDLFDPSHARKVLMAFGSAFERLPANSSQVTSEQRKFVEQAIAALAQNGEVIPVRLSLFVEMLKGKDWVPATLKEVGGIEGLGVTFLEETFTARTANPEHRSRAKAARAVLMALLPEQGVEIKGHTKSYGKLLEASGYVRDPREFADLLQVLDTELRLVTPTESEDGESGEPASSAASPQPSYQLAHDYLVPSVRDWLTRKQKETRRGRAELRLAERAELWNAWREKKQLPSLVEYAAIRCYTRSSRWTPAQSGMMRSATRYYFARGALALVLAALAIVTTIEIRGRAAANGFVVSLLRAETSDIPAILRDLEPYRRWAISRLHDVEPASDRELLHREVALLRFEGARADGSGRLTELLSRTTSEQARIIASEMKAGFSRVEDSLWQQLQRASTSAEVLSTATVIAAGAPDDSRWEGAARGIAEQIVLVQPAEAARWIENLAPVGRHLTPPLQAIFTSWDPDDRADSQRRCVAALGLAKFLRDDSANIARLLVSYSRHAPEFQGLLASLQTSPDTSIPHVRALTAESRHKRPADQSAPGESDGRNAVAPVERAANCVLAELMLGEPSALRDRLRISADRTLRSTLIHRFAELGVPPATIVSLLEAEPRAEVRAALLMGLGEYSRETLPEKLSGTIEQQLRRCWQSGHAEEHAAAKWLAARWDIASAMPHAANVQTGGDWYESQDGHRLVIIRGRLDYDFALSATEVTVAQYCRFNPDYITGFPEGLAQFLERERMNECPAIYISCYDAMQYCNWLSIREGMDESQCCYEEVGDGTFRAKPDHERLPGYRLPVFAEWQCGCTADSTTQFSFGDDIQLLPHYAWYFSNSRSDGQHRARPVGKMKPNALGLSDMYGNVWEWTTRFDGPRWSVICGGSCDNDPIDLRPGREGLKAPQSREIRIGFRIARTVLDKPARSGPPKP